MSIQESMSTESLTEIFKANILNPQRHLKNIRLLIIISLISTLVTDVSETQCRSLTHGW